MALGIGMRTIWVGLRAVNYSKPAFQAAESSVKSLTKWQERFMNQQKRLEQQSRQMFSVGLMYVALGAMVGFTMTKIIAMSKEGSQAMEKFGATVAKAGGAIGSSLLRILKPVIDVMTGFLNLIANNRGLADLIAGLMVLTTSLLLFNGIMKIVEGGLLRMHLNSLTATSGFFTLSGGFNMAAISAKGLLIVAQQLFTIFFIFYSVTTALSQALGGPLQAAIVMLIPLVAVLVGLWWSGATAMSILTLGAAAAIGIGAAVAAQATVPQFQTGTRMVRKTGPAIVHEGEAITKARDVQDLTSKPQTSTSSVLVDMRGATIQTKADKEELRPFILRTIRDATRSKE